MAVLNGTKLSDALIGTLADDQIFGFDGNDTLLGLDGNDTLDGGKGADLMDGGDGDDVYLVDNVGDIVRDSGSSAFDLVRTTISYSIASLPTIEVLSLAGKASINGTGNSSDNSIIGNAGANKLSGGSGNDNLTGSDGNDTLDGGSGNDEMLGGFGNDTFFVDNELDKAEGFTGTDTVISSVSFALAGDVENLVLINDTPYNPPGFLIGTGNALNNRMVGSGRADNLRGNAGNDTLDGGIGADALDGGAGADLLIGGVGNDEYVVDDKGDRIQESIAGSAGGIDIVDYFGTAAYVLGANLEYLFLSNSGIGTGNALDNAIASFVAGDVVLKGLAGDDVLTASASSVCFLDGGAGADRMFGGAGNDTFIVDDGNDSVSGSAGSDTIRTSLSVLQETPDVENYIFTGGPVSFAANGLGDNRLTGSKYADTLICDFGNDVLFGGGGNDTLWGGTGNDFLSGDGGADRMNGGTGDDGYEVDNAKDIIDELVSGNQGKDTIVSHISLSLTGPAILGDVENQFLSAIGTAVNGTGNALDNLIMGNSAGNKLDGAGGADTLNGMSGNDTLTIDALDVVSGGAGVDTVIMTESVELSSSLDIENYIMAKGAGALSLFAGDHDDKITGNESDNTIFARTGNDTVDGGFGNDTINGGFGDDIIVGGAGDDFISAGPGTNKINVALGNDTVQTGFGGLDSHDIISGFDGNAAGGQDLVALTVLFNDLGIAAGDRAAHVQIADKGSVVEIRIDTSTAPAGDGHFDLRVVTLETEDGITVGPDVLL